MDLFSQMSAAAASDEHALARSRQQIVSILQRFKFVRQCIKCSAKNLLNVDEVFLKAQQAVLYPITPLYDLNEGLIADDCRKALTRIFRIYDKDNDGLLSNAEINQFQSDAFSVPLVERDLAGWKKVVSKNNPTTDAVIRDGKFTVSGFLAIFDVFITQNRLEVPWKILRYFHYDDQLNLEVPEDVTSPPSAEHTTSSTDEYPALSSSARKFLTAIFHQFDSDSDGVLSTEDILEIFSVIPEPSLPPWHPVRARDIFRGCFSVPKFDPVDLSSRSTSPPPPPTTPSSPGQIDPLSASELTILSGASLPSVEISGDTDSSSGGLNAASASLPKPLSYMEWMGCWHMINTISPSNTRLELFRLGHVEAKAKVNNSKKKKKHGSSKKKASIVPLTDYSSIMIPSKEIRVLILGSKGCGKTALLNALCISLDDSAESNPLNTRKTIKPESCSIHIRINTSKGNLTKQTSSGADIESSKTRRKELVTHLIFTEVPTIDAGNRIGGQRLRSELEENCDLVALAFDCTDSDSFSHAQTLEESLLSDDMPRVYVATKADDNDNAVGDASPVAVARRHCANLDLEPPLLTSATTSNLGGSDASSYQRRENVIEHLARCALDDIGLRLKSTPHAELKRQEAARRKQMIWLGGFVCASVAVALGVGALLSSRKDAGKDSGSAAKSWFKGLLASLGGGSSGTAERGSNVTAISMNSTISVE
jgi:GTPase SAR1 family protein